MSNTRGGNTQAFRERIEQIVAQNDGRDSGVGSRDRYESERDAGAQEVIDLLKLALSDYPEAEKN